MAITAIKPRAVETRNMNNFWWADVSAKDVVAAKKFYGSVLGWDFQPETDDDGTVVYNTANIAGMRLAGLAEMQKPMVDAGMKAFWTNYILVTDVDAICAKATKLGGKVMMPAMDVMGEGRMAIIIDPTGAAFGLWQPMSFKGAAAVNQPGTITWTELFSSDLEASKTFYAGVFGWTWGEPTTMDSGSEYEMAELDGQAIAGLMSKSKEMANAPDSWITYLGVSDVEATKTEVTAAGGTVLWGPMQTGPGKSIGVMDPQGAILHLMQLDEWTS